MASDPFYLIAQVIEKPNIIFYSTILGLYNLAADIVLIPRYGIEGAAMATGSAALGTFLYFTLVYRYMYHIRLSFPWQGLGKVLINMVPLITIIGMIRSLNITYLWAIPLVGLGATTYLYLLTINKVFDQYERDLLLSRFKLPVLLPFV